MSLKAEELRAWEIKYTDEGDAYPAPKIPIYCPICANEMILHDFHPHYYSVRGFYHCDYRIKCIYCGALITGGFPISKEEAAVLNQSKLKGKILTKELLKLDLPEELKKKIEAKLKEWGYW